MNDQEGSVEFVSIIGVAEVEEDTKGNTFYTNLT